jgi:ankyrin repeat protein
MAYITHPGNLSVLHMVINASNDLNMRDELGATMLIHATKNNNIIGVELLLDLGVNFNLKDNNGRTALNYAFNDRGEPNSCALLLIGAGADLSCIYDILVRAVGRLRRDIETRRDEIAALFDEFVDL